MKDRVRNHIYLLPWKTVLYSPLCFPELEPDEVRTEQWPSSRKKDVLWVEKKKDESTLPTMALAVKRGEDHMLKQVHSFGYLLGG